MGCDIHAIVEYRDGRRWSPVFCGTVINLPRDYDIFGGMAGVRNETIEAVSAPKGLPEDGDGYYYEYLKDHAEHSFSWLTTTEFEEAIKRGDGGPEYKAVLALMRSLELSGHHARIVFGFDS